MSTLIGLMLASVGSAVSYHVWLWAIDSPRSVTNRILRRRYRDLPPDAYVGSGWILYPSHTQEF